MRPIKPWIVPKKIIIEFYRESINDSDFIIKDILIHDLSNYLVLTQGSYPFIEDGLKCLIKSHETPELLENK